jgi:hypothetical protein
MLAGCASRSATTKPFPTEGPTTQPTTQAIDPVIAQIRAEGLERSQVMDTLDYLTNVIGPRLTGSPGQKRAADWARDQFASWGLSDAHLEPWGPFGRGWSVDGYSFQVTEPTFFVPIAYPRAWSPSFAGKQVEIVYIEAEDEKGLEQYKGKLEGKIVLIGKPREVDARFEPLAKRLTEDDLQKLADYKPGEAPIPERQAAETASERRARFAAGSRRNERMMAGARPTTEAATAPATEPTTSPSESTTRPRSATSRATTGPVDPRNDPMTLRMVAFAAEEKAAVLVTGSSKGDGGTMFVQQAVIPGDAPRGSPEATTRPRVWADDAPPVPPQLIMATEDFNRLARIVKRGITVKADIDIVATEHGKSIKPENVIAEIPGTDLADEVVMVGAHLDSWHSGTGATDNGIGSACAMEAIRILKALDLRPRRTIRVALWTGEEQGIFGSAAYVKEHFGYVPKEEPATQPTTDPSTIPSSQPSTTTRAIKQLVKMSEYEKLSVYFNLDNGTGRIRGVHAQGNTFAVPIFREWLTPFADLDAKTVTLQDTGGTDHLSFDAVGLPGFQFIQDPIEYSSRTHHSNMDVYDRIQPGDAKQASTIMAAFLWNAANLPERFPRKPFEPK